MRAAAGGGRGRMDRRGSGVTRPTPLLSARHARHTPVMRTDYNPEEILAETGGAT